LSAYPTPCSSATQAWHGKMRCSPLTALFNITSSTYQSAAGPRPSWPTRSFSIYKTKYFQSRLDYQPLCGKGARAPPTRAPRGETKAGFEREAEIVPRFRVVLTPSLFGLIQTSFDYQKNWFVASAILSCAAAIEDKRVSYHVCFVLHSRLKFEPK